MASIREGFNLSSISILNAADMPGNGLGLDQTRLRLAFRVFLLFKNL